MLRLERHPFGPRVYVLRRRIHEYHLGLAVLTVLAVGAAFDVVDLGLATALAAVAGAWLIAKDWRDLMPSKRDSASWQMGLHRPVAPLRALRRTDSLPALAALVALTAGVVNLVSAATPNSGWRHRFLLRNVESLGEIRVAHALALPAAAALMVAAFYLYRRRRGALNLAVALLVALGVLNLVKGLDFEEALASFAAAGLLWWGRDSFHVRHDPVSLRSALVRVPAIIAGAAALAVASVALAAPHASFGRILRTTGDAVLWQPGPIAFHDEIGHLPLAVALLALSALLAVAYLVFRPLAAPRSLPDARARRVARRLVRRYGTDTLAFFKLRRDKQYMFDEAGTAFLAYRIENGVLLVSGDPVGPGPALPALVSQAAVYAERRGLKLAASGVSEALVPVWRQAGLRALYIGDEAVVETGSFSLEGRAIRKVRQSVARLEKSGYSSELADLSDLDERTLCELEQVTERWLAGTAERGFAMCMDSLRTEREGVVVLARDADGHIRGFLHLVPAYGRPAMSLSSMRRDRETPNGLTEFLVVKAIEALGEREVEEISLNFAAFARLMQSPHGRFQRLAGRLLTLGNPYFQIESLYRFNAKFFPRWEPRYLVYEGALGLPRAALAVMWAEGQLPKPRRRVTVEAEI